jgi:CheY-like chemotaxis protein
MEGKKILVVDDTADLLKNIVQVLVMEGYETTAAVNGQDAVNKVMESIPDLVITDLLMPVMDGYTLIETLYFQPSPSRKVKTEYWHWEQ